MNASAQVRSQLIDALRLDLVGPRPNEPDHADTGTRPSPSRRLLENLTVIRPERNTFQLIREISNAAHELIQEIDRARLGPECSS